MYFGSVEEKALAFPNLNQVLWGSQHNHKNISPSFDIISIVLIDIVGKRNVLILDILLILYEYTAASQMHYFFLIIIIIINVFIVINYKNHKPTSMQSILCDILQSNFYLLKIL